MKKLKKLMAFVITAAMCMAMAVPAMAAQRSANTITVNNAKEGETYKAYKMLELTVDNTANPTAYAYTVASAWSGFFADANSAVWGTVLEKDTVNPIYFKAKDGITDEAAWTVSNGSVSALSKFAEDAAKYAKENRLAAVDTKECAEGATSVVLNTTESGYYLVTSTLGTRAMIDTTPGNVEINEKNDIDSITKTVKEDSTSTFGAENDAQIGDEVEFKSEVTVTPRSVKVLVHDKMDAGLTFTSGSIQLFTDSALSAALAADHYAIKATPDAGDTFTIEIKDTFAATATESQKIYITYKAKLNKSVVSADPALVDQKNQTWVTFGDNQESAKAETTTKSHKFAVYKHAKDKTENLANAVFQLKKNGTVVNLIKLSDTDYRVVDIDETGTASTHVATNQEIATVAANAIVSDFVTVAAGNIVIWGVDADSDYSITEIQAPKGFNLPKADAATTSVTVAAANNTVINVENAAGTELPSTGGMGTTLFYVIGSVLVIGAAVLLVVRRRMNEE